MGICTRMSTKQFSAGSCAHMATDHLSLGRHPHSKSIWPSVPSTGNSTHRQCHSLSPGCTCTHMTTVSLCPLQTHGLTCLCPLLYPEHTCTHTPQSPCLCRHTHSHTHCLPLPSAGTSAHILTSPLCPLQASELTHAAPPLVSVGMHTHKSITFMDPERHTHTHGNVLTLRNVQDAHTQINKCKNILTMFKNLNVLVVKVIYN